MGGSTISSVFCSGRVFAVRLYRKGDVKGCFLSFFAGFLIIKSHYGSMGLVYLPTFTINNQPNVGTSTSPMDP